MRRNECVEGSLEEGISKSKEWLVQVIGGMEERCGICVGISWWACDNERDRGEGKS
jgi:hypothetical protein